jgi:hypothetical protein
MQAYFSGDKIKTDNVGGACSMQGEKITACKFMEGGPEASTFEYSHRWKDDIKMNFEVVG